jgi:hypothetical protein
MATNEPAPRGYAAEAVVAQHSAVVALRGQIALICDVVSGVGAIDLLLSDFPSLAAMALQFRPDVTLELGRGWGASTSLFRSLDIPIVSICRSNEWPSIVAPALEARSPVGWTRGVNAVVGEIADQPYERLIGDAQRVLLFWDAHGYDIASVVLGTILPLLHGREVLVVCHDMRDSRYFPSDQPYTGELWRGQSGPYSNFVRLGNVHSSFEQLVSIIDFTSRNDIRFCSPSHELDIGGLGEMFSEPYWPATLWHYFFLPKRELTFPVPT